MGNSIKKIIIAIDGYSSCGKSTMAQELAAAIGYVYVDTGAMYRAVTLYSLNNTIVVDGMVDEKALKAALPNIQIEFQRNTDGSLTTFLNGENVEKEIRSLLVSQYVSKISAFKYVREAMVAMQQKMGEKKGLVMDGRDIGTVVFPLAELKIFITADADVRAKRRYDELSSKGEIDEYNANLHNIKERDYLDETRAESPLRKANDALVLDNSKMTIEAQNKWLLDKYTKVVC